MTRPARYVTVEPNIYRYPSGILEATVRVTGCRRRRERFAAHTSLEHIRTWIADTQAACRQEARTFGELAPVDRRAATGTLEGDAPGYLAQLGTREGFKSDRSHLRAWFDVVVDGQRLGALPRHAMTTKHVNRAIAAWQQKPSPHAIRKVRVRGYACDATTIAEHTIAPAKVRAHARGGHAAASITAHTRAGSTIAAHAQAAYAVPAHERSVPATSGFVVATRTIRHRCRVLADLYHTLDGKRAPTPVDEAKVPGRPKTPPITVPVDVIEGVLGKLFRVDPKTHARFAVVTTTGQRPCQVGRARPEDLRVDDTQGVWLVRDAKGEDAHSLALNETQFAAWEAFIRADAWGTFDTTKYGRIVHAAGWPKGVRPYTARHSLAAEAIRRGVNLGDVQGLLGHADPRTTRIYAPFQTDRQRVVSAKMNSYLAGAFGPRLVKKNTPE